jgi:small subunit ribosomal protein S17
MAGEKAEAKRSSRKVRGIVVSNAMQKTIVVRSERLVSHAKYKKFIRRYTKYYAHDEENRAKVGDFVELSMTRPLSKKKRWILDRVVREAPAEAVEGVLS